MTRRIWIIVTAVILTVGAIGGVAAFAGGDDDASESSLRRTAEQFVGDLLDENVTPLEVTEYFARQCREDATEAVLAARAVVGDADTELDITNVEFESADRALVTSVLLLDGEAFGGAEEGLWVFEDGSWRNADDCDSFGT